MEDDMTTLATVALAVIGFMQTFIFIAQRRQSQLGLIETLRKQWVDNKDYWGTLVFISREKDEYYKILSKDKIATLKKKISNATNDTPTIWVFDPAKVIFALLSDACIKVLQGHLTVSDVYSIFGTEILRHSRPLHMFLYKRRYYYRMMEGNEKHDRVRREIQDWLIYRDGIRRRCLILIDLLWAEAARLEDLPPDDLLNAACAKEKTGWMNRKRIYNECKRVCGVIRFYKVIYFTYFLRHSEFFKWHLLVGLSRKRLEKLNKEWIARLLQH